MPSIVRLGDTCSGHGCFPPRNNDQGSPNVFINGIPAHRLGDHWTVHCCLPPGTPCHDSSMGAGSPNVFINGLPAARLGDAVACGSTAAGGSPNVFAN